MPLFGVVSGHECIKYSFPVSVVCVCVSVHVVSRDFAAGRVQVWACYIHRHTHWHPVYCCRHTAPFQFSRVMRIMIVYLPRSRSHPSVETLPSRLNALSERNQRKHQTLAKTHLEVILTAPHVFSWRSADAERRCRVYGVYPISELLPQAKLN